MDDLLHFVRHEVAMDGDDGTPIDRLDSFIHTYYARAAENHNNNESSSSSSIPTQNIDEPFKDFVWKQLASLPELKVAFLRKIEQNPVASTSAVTLDQVATPEIGSLPPLPLPEVGDDAADTSTPAGNNDNNGSMLLDEEGNIVDQGDYNLKNKAKIKASRKDNQKRDRDARLSGGNDIQYEFIEIQDEEIQSLNRKELLEKYGDTLRIAADPETCYVALTGSHERFGKLTALAYQVLQAIARGRENGKTVVELGKEFEHDQKSLFHFVKSLVELNLIIKMKVLDARSQTSRCIHRHYLETSQHWATWMTKDPNQDNTKAEDDDDDLSKTTALTIMTVAHLNSNEPLVRSRIINALRSAPENLIPHLDLVFAIGFHARPGREHRRRLNRIISSMERQGLVEKIGVARQGAKGLLSCLKLCTSEQQDGEEAMPHSLSEEDEVEQRPNLLLTLPIERQVVDLLVSSGAQGLTIRELQAGLGDVGIRSLETLLTRMEKNFEPPHLCDYRIQSVYETYGREKRLRYFTTAGYHERCRLDGIGDIANMNDFTHPDLAGGFSILDKPEFYASPEEFASLASRMQTNSRPGVKYPKNGGKGKAKTLRDPSEPIKKGRPKGSTKKAKEAKSKAENGETPLPDAANAQNTENGEGKTKKKRQKKEKVEGEEGQPPKKKAKPRKSQQAQGDQAEQASPADEATVAGPSGTSGPATGESNLVAPLAPTPLKKKSKPRKNKVDTAGPASDIAVPTEATASPSPSTPVPLTTGATEQAEAQDIPVPQSKKKGRPPKDKTDDDDPSGSKKKRKAEVDPETGLPIKGRPRKYPPGTTSTQRKILLEERRAAGLEPPSKKQKGNSENGDNGSVPPSNDTPVPENGTAPSTPVVGSGTNVSVAGDVTAVQSPTRQTPSAGPVGIADDSGIAEEVEQKPNSTVTVPSVTEDTVAATSTASASLTLPADIDPSLESTSIESLPPLPAGWVDDSFPSSSNVPPVASPPQLAKRMTHARKSTLREVSTAGENTQPPIAVEDTTSRANDAPEQVVSIDVVGNASVRRSSRQKTGDMPTTTPVRPRRGRSSKVLPDDITVKVEELAATTAVPGEPTPQGPDTLLETLPEVSEQVNNPQSDAHADLENSDRAPPASRPPLAEPSIHASLQESTILPAEAAVLAGSLSASAKAPKKTRGKGRKSEAKPEMPDKSALPAQGIPTESHIQHDPATDLRDASRPTQESFDYHQSGVNTPAATPLAQSQTEATINAVDPPEENLQRPIDLPAMPEPLPGSTPDVPNSDPGIISGPVDIAPNVVAKPVHDNANLDKVPDRRNHSMQVHENEYIATLQDIGGIAEEGIPLDKLWQEFMQRRNPNKPPPKSLDRRTMKGIATSLEKRGLVKRSILQFQNFDGKMVQRPIMYLANISLDSPEMREFAVSMQEKMEGTLAGPKNWLSGRKTLDKTDELAIAPRRGPRPVGEVPTDPRPFFLKNWRVVAQYFGWQYGFLARARTLHEHLVRSITDENDSNFIVSSDPRVRIFASPFVLLDTPLSVFMQIAAVSEYSTDLEEFLKQEHASTVLIRDLPPVLSGLFGAKRAKGYSRFSQLFEVLMLLKLLVPVEQVEYETPIVAYSGAEREPRYFAARQERSGATYWLLPGQAPIYDLQEKKASEQKLLGQLPIWTADQATQYWNTMHRVTFGAFDRDSLPRPTVNYPPVLNAPLRFVYAARTSSHWRSDYLLLAQQKTYLRRSAEEAISKDALLSNDAKIEELAHNICAPPSIVRAYYAKPHLGARPEWAKKRKRRATARPKNNESDTSASEAEGPVAPKPRSELTEEATLERKRAEKAARATAKLRKQQQIIAMKARGASQAKQGVWNGIVNGFKLQHGEEALKVVQLDFLHTWFMSSEGPTATTIQQHLEQAVEGVRTVPIAITSRSVFASKTGSVVNRGREKRMKTKPRQRAAVSIEETPLEDDFNLQNLPELPEVIPSDQKKTAKSGWTLEEDEQLTDLYVILQSRANDRATKLSMEPATVFHHETKAKALVDRLRCLATKPGEVSYLDALQDAWSRLWHNGRIRDPLLHDAARNVTKEGLLLLRRLLNGVLNKQSIRFQAIMPAEAAAASQTHLPADPYDLKKSFLVEYKAKPEDPESPQTWDYLWSMVTTAQKSAKFNYQPFRTQYEPRWSASPATSQERMDLFHTRYKPFSRVPANYVKDAEAFEKRLAEEGVVEWGPICEDGDMLAVAHLFSEDLLKFSVDTTVTRAGRPYTDYRTRKIDDDNFENSLTIQPNQAFLGRSDPIFSPDLVTAPKQELADQASHK